MKRFKPLLATAAAALMIGNAAMAEDIPFIGAEVKYHGMEAQEPATRKSYEDSTAALGLKIGAQNERYRVALMYDVIADSDEGGGDISQYLFLGTLDYMLPIEHPTLHPYFGLCLGYGEYEFDKYSDDDFVYGLEGGLVYTVNRHVDVDLFGRYLWPNIDAVDYYFQAGIGVNYKF